MPSTLPSLFSSPSSAPAITIPSPNSPLHLSYKSLSSAIDSFAEALLSLGVKPGTVVSSSLPNSLEFVLSFFATAQIRCVAAPLNPAYSVSEIEFYLNDTTPVVLLIPANTPENHATREAGKKCNVKVVEIHLSSKRGSGESGVTLKTVYAPETKQSSLAKVANDNQKQGGEAQEQDVALVLHTSGTTGRPKGVPLTHLNLLTTMQNICNTYEFTPKDRGLLVMPLFHVHGLVCGLLAPLLAGASVVIPAKFSATTFWRDFIAEKCNWYTAVPTIHSILLASPQPSPLPHIRFIRSCSSSLSPTVFHLLESTFKAPVLEAYAMSEAAHAMCGSPLPKNGPRYPGSVGKPQGVELTIRDSSTGKEVKVKKGEEETKGRGEVCIRGRNVMLGYLNNEKANTEGYWPAEEAKFRDVKEKRWFRTGDEGYLTGEGYLVLTGRLKELINRGGEKISPIELDSALLSLEGVAEAVCFGVEDIKYGEKVWAAVVLKQGIKEDAKTVENRLKKSLEGKVAKFKIPERIIVTPVIPKTATGKIQRRHVREKFVKEEAEKAKGSRQSKL